MKERDVPFCVSPAAETAPKYKAEADDLLGIVSSNVEVVVSHIQEMYGPLYFQNDSAFVCRVGCFLFNISSLVGLRINTRHFPVSKVPGGVRE